MMEKNKFIEACASGKITNLVLVDKLFDGENSVFHILSYSDSMEKLTSVEPTGLYISHAEMRNSADVIAAIENYADDVKLLPGSQPDPKSEETFFTMYFSATNNIVVCPREKTIEKLFQSADGYILLAITAD